MADGFRVRVFLRGFNTEVPHLFLGENMRNALAALALTDIAEERPARPARAARPVLPARKSGAQGYTTGDILAMLIEVGALEDLGLTDRLKSRPVAVPADGRGHAVDRLL